MVVEDSDKEDSEEEYEEAKVEYWEELLCAIEVIRRKTRNYKWN